MRWKSGRIFTSKTLTGEWVGLEEIDDGIWSVYLKRALTVWTQRLTMDGIDHKKEPRPWDARRYRRSIKW
jgi:hypothetical protein